MHRKDFDRIYSREFSPDSRHVLLAIRRLGQPFDESTGRKPRKLEGEDVAYGSTTTRLSANGQWLATSDPANGSIVLWDSTTASRVSEIPKASLPRSSQERRYFEFSPSGKILIAIGDTRARLFNVPQGTLKGALRTGRDEDHPRRLQFSPDEALVIGQRHENGFSVWNAANGDRLFELASSDKVSDLVFDKQSKVVTGVCGNVVRRWDLATGAILKQYDIPKEMQDSELSCRLSHGGELLAIGLSTGKIFLWVVGDNTRNVELLGLAGDKGTR